MTDTEKKIAEIREALEKATPGPWKWVDSGGYARKKLVGEYEIMNFGASMPYSEVAGQEPDDNDAHLIANAPEWLRFLLSELDKRGECTQENPCRECLKKSAEGYKELMRELDEENDLLRERLYKLIDGLRSIRKELDRRFRESDQKWEREADMYEQGKSAAYDEADLLICDILREIGVNVDGHPHQVV